MKMRVTAGLIAGGIIGAVGLSYALNDRRTRKKMMRDGRKLISKAGDALDDMPKMW